MRCERCGAELKEGEGMGYLGRLLCEYCYMDAISPTRTCDPWAVYTAKSGEVKLTERQEKILELIEKTGGLTTEEIASSLNLRLPEVEREVAVLRHMEKVRAAMKDGKKVIVKW